MAKKEKKFVWTRYERLYEHFGEMEFTFEEALDYLKQFGDNKALLLRVFHEMDKQGLMEMRSLPEDRRKKMYRLKTLAETIGFKKSQDLTRQDLEGILKKAADRIRTRVDYKFILILLFLKWLSDRREGEYEKAKKELIKAGLSEEEAEIEAKKKEFYTFYLPEECVWENIRKETTLLPEKLQKALKRISDFNPAFKGVVDSVEFIQFSNQENLMILKDLMEIFSARSLKDVSTDILGDAYEWILRYFAPQKAKEGEIYTPREVIRLLVEMLTPDEFNTLKIFDPACGSGGMLIVADKYIKEKFGKAKAKKVFLNGQEANNVIYAICVMNLYLHEIMDAHIEIGDSLTNPRFVEDSALQKFDLILANPPWNQDGYGEVTLKNCKFWKEIYKYGFPTSQSADWAWIQLMLAHTENDGKVGIVIDNGALFRGGREGNIRRKILEEEDWIECVILLPEKLFYNTGAPGAIIVFNKNKEKGRKNKILFINASNEYERHPEVRKLNRLGNSHIAKIVEAYKKFEEKDGFSRVVSLKEIKENDYNLNVTLYVYPEEKKEEIDIEKEWGELQKIEKEITTIEQKIKGYLSEIK